MAQSIDRQIFGDLYPSLRRFAAVVGDDDMEPDDLVQEVLASAPVSYTHLTLPTIYSV